MKHLLLVPAIGIQLAFAGNYKVEFVPEMDGFLGNASNASASILKTRNKPYSESNMNAKAAYLKTLGFQGDKKASDGDKTTLTNEDKDQLLGYDQGTSSYFYHNGQVDWIPKEKPADLGVLDAKAQSHLAGILGNDAKDFVLANAARTGIIASDDVERTASVTYIYKRKHKGRVIHGSTNEVQIELASDGNIRSFFIEDRDLVELRTDVRLAKKSKVKDLLSKKREKEGFGDTKVKGVKYLKGMDSYFQKRLGTEILLIPHVSSYVETEIVGSESVKSWDHVGVSAEDNADLTEGELEGYPLGK